MTAGLHVVEFTVRWRPDRQIHDVVPTVNGRLLLDLIDPRRRYRALKR